MIDRIILDYDLERYPFPRIVEEHVGSKLTHLHEEYSYERFARGTEQHTDLHKLLYAIGPSFREAYLEFLSDVVRPLLGDAIVYQRIPNFRFQLPGNIAVRNFHRDREDGHQPAEINFWVPLTPIEPSNAVWIESFEGGCDFSPALVQPGQVLVFDGANLEHGNHESRSATTRVNFDFRVIRRPCYVETDATSMYRGIRFKIGEYYDVIE
jgi:ectoine hydroxylase-related dioxygenase (phytanoyl-CoA dioxygenase family)